MIKIEDSDIKDMAGVFGIDYKLIKTVFIVESSGSGFNKDGSLKIQFEPHVFKKYTGTDIENKVDVQSKEYSALEQAKIINKKFALMSCSWGLPQIMGYHFKVCGYASVEEMVESFKASEKNQLKAMMSFIKANKTMWNALINHDWALFAKKYNGTNYKKNEYDVKLKKAFEEVK